MAWGKMLSLAAIGVGAVAAAPFTGGGSLLGAATLASSLAGAGVAAGTAGAVGLAAGKVWADAEEKKERDMQNKVSSIALSAAKSENITKEYEKGAKVILALSALGIAMANADGEISPEERIEIDEFVGGIASTHYPEIIKKEILGFTKNPPNFNDAIKYLKNVPQIEYKAMRGLLVTVMEADGSVTEKEKAFLQAFDKEVSMLTH